jgi:hypothetical protein
MARRADIVEAEAIDEYLLCADRSSGCRWMTEYLYSIIVAEIGAMTCPHATEQDTELEGRRDTEQTDSEQWHKQDVAAFRDSRTMRSKPKVTSILKKKVEP